jgi:CDP-glucose 4,6-dehydratase
MIQNNFWKGKKVFVTGHTGFKGTWLCIWLKVLGAKVYGYSLAPSTSPSIFKLTKLENFLEDSFIGNIKDIKTLKKTIIKIKPQILFHLAAQPSVRESYRIPLETIETNVLGTANVLEAIKDLKTLKSVVIITTDKVYENNERNFRFIETNKLGGKDVYSASKAASEMVLNAYRSSFFFKKINIASARSGNVLGGGDWKKDRIVPDCLKAFSKKKNLTIRYPKSVRPWQHVLEPLYGYMLLAQKLYDNKIGYKYADAWNFGPLKANNAQVIHLAQKLKKILKSKSNLKITRQKHVYEAKYLSLNSAKSKKYLKWKNFLNLNNTLVLVASWFDDYKKRKNLRETCINQIKFFTKKINE